MAITITGRITQTGKALTLPTPTPLTPGDMGIFLAMYNDSNIIEYIIISSPGDSADFGDMLQGTRENAGASSGANDRGVFGGGAQTPSRIEWITITSLGNAVYFGDLSVGRNALTAASNGPSERAVFSFGQDGSSTNILDWITISSTGNATDFGDAAEDTQLGAGISNSINDRGVFAAGLERVSNEAMNMMWWITLSSSGTSTDFGDLTVRLYRMAGVSDGINERGIFAGGFDENNVRANVIDYITISSTGNAGSFGGLEVHRSDFYGVSNGINEIGVFGGGRSAAGSSNIIDYLTITSLGDTVDFGDLSIITVKKSAVSNGAT